MRIKGEEIVDPGEYASEAGPMASMTSDAEKHRDSWRFSAISIIDSNEIVEQFPDAQARDSEREIYE